MGFSRVSRFRPLLALALALCALLQSLPARALAPQTAGDFFDSMGGAPLVPRAPKISGRPPAPARPGAAPSVFFNGIEVPSFVFSRQKRVSKTLVSVIDKTQRQMDLALYIFSLPEAAEAVLRAWRRGVAVRVIIDHGHAFPAAEARSKELEQLIQSGIPVRTLRGFSDYGIMHNKFGIYDGKLVSAGSYNWTTAADVVNFENALFRGEPEILAAFRGYWDWMWARAVPLPGLSEPLDDGEGFEAAAALSFKGQPWPAASFSPQGGTEALIIRAIDLCRKSLDIAMFSFFSENVGRAVLRAKERGVSVRVVMDRGQGRNSPVRKLFADNGVDFRYSSGVNGRGVLHHKFALFDGEMVETGSFNYSNNAEFNSYENAVYLTGRGDVEGFLGEFEFVYGQALPPTLDELSAPIESSQN